METDVEKLINGLEVNLTSKNKDLSTLSSTEQYNVLVEKSSQIVQPDLLKYRLEQSKKTGVPLVVKYGIDPTAKDIHLGHIVPIITARRLQQMGHKIIIVIGDFTALVGDPTGRVKNRPVLGEDAILENIKEFSKQISTFLDLSKTDIVYNSSFYKKMSIKDLMMLYRQYKIAPLLQRDDFRNRIEGLTIAEVLYPTLMAIDSINIMPDIELGGKDQLLNFQITVEIMRSQGLKPECAITTELLKGTSGDESKMSKSLGNFISLTESPDSVYGKIMSIPDSYIEHYFDLLTDIAVKEWDKVSTCISDGSLNPMDVKKLLARIIVTMLYSREEAEKSQKEFEAIFSKSDIPEDLICQEINRPHSPSPWIDILTELKLVPSKTLAREHIKNGALRLYKGHGKWLKIADPHEALPNESSFVVKLGKRGFASIKIK